MWHQWRPVFNGHWTERGSSSHLVGDVHLNRGVFAVVAIATVIVGAWLFAGLQAVLLGVVGHTAVSPMLLFAGVAMPVLFGLVAFAIFWTSYGLYVVDRDALQTFLERAFADEATSRSPKN